MNSFVFKKDGHIVFQVCDTTGRNIEIDNDLALRVGISDKSGGITDIWIIDPSFSVEMV